MPGGPHRYGRLERLRHASSGDRRRIAHDDSRIQRLLLRGLDIRRLPEPLRLSRDADACGVDYRGGRRLDGRRSNVQCGLLPKWRDVRRVQPGQLLPWWHVGVRVSHRHVVRRRRDGVECCSMHCVQRGVLPRDGKHKRAGEPVCARLLLHGLYRKRQSGRLPRRLFLPLGHGLGNGKPVSHWVFFSRGHSVHCAVRCVHGGQLPRAWKYGGLYKPVQCGHVLPRWFDVARWDGMPCRLLLLGRYSRPDSALRGGHVQRRRRSVSGRMLSVQPWLLCRRGQHDVDVEAVRGGLLLSRLCDATAMPRGLLLPRHDGADELSWRHGAELDARVPGGHALDRWHFVYDAILVHFVLGRKLSCRWQLESNCKRVLPRVFLPPLYWRPDTVRLPGRLLLRRGHVVGHDDALRRGYVQLGRQLVHVEQRVHSLLPGQLSRNRQHNIVVEPVHGGLLLHGPCTGYDAVPVCSGLLLPRGHRLCHSHYRLLSWHVVRRWPCVCEPGVVHCVRSGQLSRTRQRDAHVEPLHWRLLLRYLFGRALASAVPCGLVLSKRLKWAHYLPDWLFFGLQRSFCVHALHVWQLLCNGQHDANINPVHGRIFLQHGGCKHTTRTVPRWPLLRCRPGVGHGESMPGWHLWSNDGPYDVRMHGNLRPGLLHNCGKHVEHIESVCYGLLLRVHRRKRSVPRRLILPAWRGVAFPMPRRHVLGRGSSCLHCLP